MLENALPISITQLSACLKQAGIEVDLFDTTFYKWGEKSDTEHRIESLQIKPCPLNYNQRDIYNDFKAQVEKSQPDLLGFSVVEPTFHLAIKLLQHAHSTIKRYEISVAMGGVHVILAPETILPYANLIDYISISEGEEVFIDLCRKLGRGESVRDQPGFWIQGGGNMEEK